MPVEAVVFVPGVDVAPVVAVLEMLSVVRLPAFASAFALFASVFTALLCALTRCLSAFAVLADEPFAEEPLTVVVLGAAPLAAAPLGVGAFVVVGLPALVGLAASVAATDSARARTTRNINRRIDCLQVR